MIGRNSTMNDRANKTSICSIVFLDIIDYSKKSGSEQIEIKNQFNNLINHSLKDIAQDERIILDTGDGAAIAYIGSPEDALFTSLSILDEILKNNIMSAMPLYVRIGINQGPVRIVNDINGQPNIIGDGVNVAERIMSFAKPNQILVSRSYYEVTSRLTHEISQMFDYSGNKHDKHMREHEIYSVRLLKETTQTESKVETVDSQTFFQSKLHLINSINWRYVVLALPALVAFAIMMKMVAEPVQPTIIMEDAPIVAKPSIPVITAKPNKNALMPNETVEDIPQELISAENIVAKDNVLVTNQTTETVEKTLEQKLAEEELAKAKLAKKQAKAKAKLKAESELSPELAATPAETAGLPNAEAKSAEPPIKTASQPSKTEELKAVKTKEKSGWKTFTDSLKQGQEKTCSQSEIAMNQCH